MDLQKDEVMLYLASEDDENDKLQNAWGPNLVQLNEINTANVALKKITKLEISHSNISKLPSSITGLSLKELILSHNKFSEVPSCLYSGLKQLQKIDLSHNLLNDFDVAPACHINIRILDVSNNAIKNFPYWVVGAHCPHLHEVYYSNNKIMNIRVPRATSIKRLEMRNSQMLDEDFRFLKSVKSLEFLDIGNEDVGKNENRFKDISELFTNFKWANLRTLKLNSLFISIIPEGLFYVDSLVELHLVKCDLNWIPESISYLLNLEFLDVSSNAICSLPSRLMQLENLKIVKAPHNGVSAVGPFANKLQILDLYENRIEGVSFDLDCVEFIDLESNLFETRHLNEYHIYREKMEAYRLKFALERVEGRQFLPEPPNSDQHSSISDYLSYDDYIDSLNDSLTEEHSPNQNFGYLEECWDEEKPVREKNPEVTSSDEEWTASEKIQRKTKKTPTIEYDQDEDWIFTDAEECL